MTNQNSTSSDAQVRSQNNKAILAGVICAVVGTAGGYYINEHNLLAKPGESGKSDGGSLSDAQKSEVEDIVKDVISENPELLMASLKSMEKKMYEKQMAKAAEGLKNYKKELLEDKNSPVAGAKNAKVTIVEFFDYHCGYCKKVAPTMKRVLEEHDDVRIVFKEFPILSPDSHNAARAALAVYSLKPEKYFDFHQMLMEHRAEYSDATLQDFASKLGIDAEDLQKAMKSDAIEDELKQATDLAQKLGIQGTPAIIVGDELIPGAVEYDALEFRIKAAKNLANKKD